MIQLDLSIFQNQDYNPYLVRIPHNIYRQMYDYAVLNYKKYKSASKTIRTKQKVVQNITVGKCGEWAYQMLCEYQLQTGVFNSNFGVKYKNVSYQSRTHDFELENGTQIDVKTVPFLDGKIKRRVYVSDDRCKKTYVLMRFGYNSQDHSYYCEYIGQLDVDSRNSEKINNPFQQGLNIRTRLNLLCTSDTNGELSNTPIVFDKNDRPYIKMYTFYNRELFDDNLSTYSYQFERQAVILSEPNVRLDMWSSLAETGSPIPRNYYDLLGDFTPTQLPPIHVYNREDYVDTGTTGTPYINTHTASCIVHTTQNPSPGVYTTIQYNTPVLNTNDEIA